MRGQRLSPLFKIGVRFGTVFFFASEAGTTDLVLVNFDLVMYALVM